MPYIPIYIRILYINIHTSIVMKMYQLTGFFDCILLYFIFMFSFCSIVMYLNKRLSTLFFLFKFHSNKFVSSTRIRMIGLESRPHFTSANIGQAIQIDSDDVRASRIRINYRIICRMMHNLHGYIAISNVFNYDCFPTNPIIT